MLRFSPTQIRLGKEVIRLEGDGRSGNYEMLRDDSFFKKIFEQQVVTIRFLSFFSKNYKFEFMSF